MKTKTRRSAGREPAAPATGSSGRPAAAAQTPAASNLATAMQGTPDPARTVSTVTAPRFRDRIRELRRVPASTLRENEMNWRRHPDEQRGAITSMLERIGIVGALVAREKDGTLELLDGHLRRDIAGNDDVPVLIVDLNDEEAALMLASFDPLGELAIMDADALRKLLEQAPEEVDDNAFFRALLADVDNEIGKGTARSKEVTEHVVEGMELSPHEHYDFLVVCAQTTHEWNVLIDKLGLTPVKRRAKMGIGRAIRATRLLEKLNAVPTPAPASSS